MLFNILLVLLVTCFATATIPTTMFAKENKYDVADVVIENASHPEMENASAEGESEEDDDESYPSVGDEDDGDELDKVSFDPAATQEGLEFTFDGLDEGD